MKAGRMIGGAVIGTIGGIIIGYILGFALELLCFAACIFGCGDGKADGSIMVYICGIAGCLVGGYTGWASAEEKSKYNTQTQQNMQYNQNTKINQHPQNVRPTSDIVQSAQDIRNQSWQPTVTYNDSIIDDFLEGLDDNLYV